MHPPLLKALILILFYEGGVGSMKAKRKTEKQNEILGQIFKPTRDVAMGCFCEEKQLHMSLYIHIQQFQSLAFSGFHSSRKRIWSKVT